MPADSLNRGDVLTDWVIDEVIQRGGVACYRAHRAGSPDDDVMIEVAPRDARDGLRLRREAFALRHLDHDALPLIVDKGDADDGRFFWVAKRWFQGELLGDVLREGPMTWQDASSVFHQLASAVLSVHQSGMVHRDIHPGKIRLNHALKVRLSGFELAMSPDELNRVERPPLGDLAYVAPEVIADRNCHVPRADLYSVGVIFYEVLTGSRAFPAALWGDRSDPESRMIAWKSRADALDPGPDVPRWLRNLVQKSTHPDPERRLPDMDAMVGWLDAARDQWTTPVPQDVAVAPNMSAPPPQLSGIAPSFLPPPMTAQPGQRQLAPQQAVEPQGAQGYDMGLPLWIANAVAVVLGIAAGIPIGMMVLILFRLSPPA